MRIIALLLVAIAVSGVLAAANETNAASPVDREADPVVLTGADLPLLTGLDPDDIVAFKYDGAWQQIPVQVDERDVKDYCDVYDGGGGVSCGVTALMYTDSGTFTGPDSDATFDSNDELVFMAKDAGGIAPTSTEPADVVGGSGVTLTINDPLAPGKPTYAYLFESAGALTPDAGQQYVTYTFSLSSGSYLSTYDTSNGPNPENSSVTTPFYGHHFSDRWISDEIEITAGVATGVDILDRHKALFAPGQCVRSEDTFSNAEGAFIVNKSGPVRALRSYVGANSGPLTQREHVLYAQRQDIRTFLRVHAIPSVMDFFDYSPAASGMTYYNSLNTSGVTIDGSPDSPTAGPYVWEMVEGAQGSLVMAGSVSTNIGGFGFTSYYLDDTTPPDTQCTGDAFAYGSSGTWVNQALPCTDPGQSCTNYLDVTRTMYYDAPGLTVTDAEELTAHAAAPLTVDAEAFQVLVDTDGDGCPDAQENGSDPTMGGLRDYQDPNDYYDVLGPNQSLTHDGVIDLGNDILGVILHYAPTGQPPYDVRFDRGQTIAEMPHWKRQSPDGVIDLANDILGVIQQYAHNCA